MLQIGRKEAQNEAQMVMDIEFDIGRCQCDNVRPVLCIYVSMYVCTCVMDMDSNIGRYQRDKTYVCMYSLNVCMYVCISYADLSKSACMHVLTHTTTHTQRTFWYTALRPAGLRQTCHVGASAHVCMYSHKILHTRSARDGRSHRFPPRSRPTCHVGARAQPRAHVARARVAGRAL